MEPNTNNSGIMPKQGWSWGGFMFNIGFLIASKRYSLLWWYLLALIPIVNIIFLIAFAIYLGVNGHKISVSGNQFANQSEYDGFTKALDHAGKILFFVVIAILVISILFAIVGVSIGGVFTPGMHMMAPSTSGASY